MSLDDVRPARHQQQPRIVRVVDHQHAATAAGRRTAAVSRSSCGWRDQDWRHGGNLSDREQRRAIGQSDTWHGSATTRLHSPLFARYRSREVGGGRTTRQPGQVRKEAALTSFGSGRSSASHPFIFACEDGAGTRFHGDTERKRRHRSRASGPWRQRPGGACLPRAGAQIPPLHLRRT